MDVCFCDETFEASSIGPPLINGVLYYPLRPFTIIKIGAGSGDVVETRSCTQLHSARFASSSPPAPIFIIVKYEVFGVSFEKLELLGIRFPRWVDLLEFRCP